MAKAPKADKAKAPKADKAKAPKADKAKAPKADKAKAPKAGSDPAADAATPTRKRRFGKPAPALKDMRTPRVSRTRKITWLRSLPASA